MIEIKHRDGRILHVDHEADDVREAVMSAADRRVELAGARLDGADLAGLDLERARLAGASLDGASLDGSNLEEADLSGASLVGATLRGANLEDADLEGA